MVAAVRHAKVFEFIRRLDGITVLVPGRADRKELVAHAIHRNSQRAERPFVAINCAAIAIPSGKELFGHEGRIHRCGLQKRAK